MDEKNFDKSNMKKVLEGFHDQIKEAYEMPISIKLQGNPSYIVICGMGGSSIAGQLLETYLKSKRFNIPIFNIQSYDIPAFADKNTLFIINSYSGNTEEELNCLKQSLKICKNIIVISTGGKLIEMANYSKIAAVRIPSGYQPRNAVAYLFFPLLKILEENRIIPQQKKLVDDLINSLKKRSFESTAKNLAEELYGKLPIIYSSEFFYPVAYRMKCELNENSKIMAFSNKFPELNHNELNGFVNHKYLNFPFHIIMLKDEYDQKRIIKRMSVTKHLIKKLTDKASFTEISIIGDNELTRLFMAVHLGDLIGYYLALKYSTDPTPVDLIEEFKKGLGPYIN